jgi:hypothetical protein
MESIDTVPVLEEEPTSKQQQDYFGFSETKQHFLPDGVTYVEIRAMNEGAKARFQKRTQRDLTLEKGSGNARFSMDPAKERHELIKECVVGWNFMRGGVLIPFGERGMNDFLMLANPRIIEEIELEIRKMNPWLLNELTVEEIDKQMEELRELREIAVEREAGEGSSSSR